MRALIDVNIPKFVEEDIPIFEAILRDVFPGTTVPVLAAKDLQSSIIRSIQEQGLQVDDACVNKVL